jgi:hypothetical protein
LLQKSQFGVKNRNPYLIEIVEGRK